MNNTSASSASIAILMATFNGGRFLPDQLDSLWQQTRQDFDLYVRDDGSSDETLNLLRTAAAEHPGRLHIVANDSTRLGPKRSFLSLLHHTDAHYIAFCDQDDFWLPHKLERLVNAAAEAESSLAADAPVLCCSDATVADATLKPMDGTYFDRHGIRISDGRDLALSRLLFRNFAIGATTMVNSALARRCRQVPAAAIMHDWWMALVATALGRAVVLTEPLILYRQHSANAVGSRLRAFPRTWNQMEGYLELSRATAARCVAQAVAFNEHFAPLPPQSARILEPFATFAEQGWMRRASTLIRSRAFKPGLALNGLHLYACITAPF
jgi:glycosyltransferase involved in cell wall biosynthesis